MHSGTCMRFPNDGKGQLLQYENIFSLCKYSKFHVLSEVYSFNKSFRFQLYVSLLKAEKQLLRSAKLRALLHTLYTINN